MKIRIDMNDNLPAYIQLSQQIAAAIQSGEYSQGDKLPSESEFCSETGLAKGTVRKTFDRLEAEGYIRRVHGSGTYVQGWRPELRRMALFEENCRKEGLKPEEGYRLLEEACNRFFAMDIPERAAMIDCTPEIAGDITRELLNIWNFDMTYYQIDNVRAGMFIPPEEIWITTKTHYEEILPVAQKSEKILLQVRLAVPDREEKEIEALDDDFLLGIVYDSQDFLMHISHTLALLGRHNTYYLCQKEEWNDKKRAIRTEDIIWLVSVQEEEIIRQMEAMGSHYIVFNYGVTKESLEEVKQFMERRRKQQDK